MTAVLPEDASSITDEALDDAASSRASALTMLRHIGKIIASENGVSRMLAMFAYVAASDWVDGDLCVEIAEAKSGSNAAFLVSLGMGKMERVLPPVALEIDFETLKNAALSAPQSAEPLVPTALPDRLSFALPDAISRSTSPPEYVSVAAQNMSFPYSAVGKAPAESSAISSSDQLAESAAERALDAGWDADSGGEAVLIAVDEPFADSSKPPPKSPKRSR